MSDSQGEADRASLPPDWRVETLGIAFFDLSRFADWTSSEDDLRIAEFLQTFYLLAGERLHSSGARLVKFMGDSGLAVSPPERVEEVVLALCTLARETRQRAAEFGLDSYLNVNVHVGPVVAGQFGLPGEERYDVIGKAVNIVVRLGRRGVVLSPQAFRCLSREARQEFAKHTPPVTYRYRF